MKPRTVKINEMRIRVPSTTTRNGHGFGQAVAQRLADTSSSFNSLRGRIGAMTVRVKSEHAKSAEQLTDAIIARIRRE